jgi:MarR family transcriptional regulator, lower aerobic nicotinate degradation pathway regulator
MKTSGAHVHRSSPRELNAVDGMAQLSFLVQRMLERRAGDHDLSIIQTRLLGVLRDRTPTMNELGKLLALDKSSISGLVERAERRGLVARAPSPTDGRSVLVSLTDTGRAVVSNASTQFANDIHALLKQLTPADRRTLSRLISQLLVAHAAEQNIDLFPITQATQSPASPQPDHGGR